MTLGEFPDGRRGTRLAVELGTADAPEVLSWMVWQPSLDSPDQIQVLHSYAVLAESGPILIDPCQPVPSALEPFESILGAPPLAVIMTSPWHGRDAVWFRNRYGSKTYAPSTGIDQLEAQPDFCYNNGEDLPGSVTTHWTGDDCCGDTILQWVAPGGSPVIFTGDVLSLGNINPITGRVSYPDLLLSYSMWDSRSETFMRNALSELIALEFQVAFSAHHPDPLRDLHPLLDRLHAEGEYLDHRKANRTRLILNR